ncbi:acyl-CoA N-acyltransferase [Cercophora newfieldiana]|uniref:Acyl-CoA N-acyltransferase n=1 Tax=Cercophora newfieldiana TaxID=92897 RepID=A0AA39XRE0_9PEZI|nr:acyl-CoA N-acyltransferase [Cercophora newfieldiana]
MAHIDLTNAWRSARLVYRAIEDDDEDKTHLHALNEAEPTGMAMVSTKLLAPGNKSSTDNFLTFAKKAYLTVFVCLAPSDEDCTEKTTKKRPAPIGYLVLWPRRSDRADHHRSAEMGLCFAPEERGKGYGSEAINWALDWGFRKGGLHRVGLAAFGYNPGAVRLYKRLGFVEEGREREALWFERRWWDVVSMGMLEGEWEVLRRWKGEGSEGGVSEIEMKSRSDGGTGRRQCPTGSSGSAPGLIADCGVENGGVS